MSYYAIIKLEDQSSNDVWKMRGEAQEALARAMVYISKKDQKRKSIKEFIKEDFEEFETFLSKFFEENYDGRHRHR